MSVTFQAIPDPGAETVGDISALDPSNPFHTNEYGLVRARLGARTVAIVQKRAGVPVAGCLGFLTEGRMNSRLEITSLPRPADPAGFWSGLFQACKSMRIAALSVQSFASTSAVIPETRHRISHKNRSEYRLDLTVPDLSAIMNRRHRRQVKAARDAGLELRCDDGPEARRDHLLLANRTLDRLRIRGETIDSAIIRDEVDAFLDLGAGRLFQAVIADEVFASLLVAISPTGAYGQSSGTSDRGRDIGASHFIFHATAENLRSEGFVLFNLGGADEHSGGLREFKTGMGSTRIDLESAEFYTSGFLKRFASRAAALVRR